MWHALRTELAYLRVWLLGALAMAVAVSTLVTIIFRLVDSDAPEHVSAGLRGMFLIMAPMIVGFIAQAFRSEERRTRLLMAGPLTPRQLAGVMVLLPTTLFVIGIAAAGLMIGAEALFIGKFEIGALNMAGYVGGLLFMYSLMGLLAQEAGAAHRQRRLREAFAGWAGFVVAILFLVAVGSATILLQGPRSWPGLHLGNLFIALAAMAGSVALYTRRTDFTR